MAGITKETLQAQIASLVKAYEPKGPTYSPKELRNSEQPVQQAVEKWITRLEEEAASLAGATEPGKVRRRQLIEGHLPTLRLLLPMHDDTHRRFDKAIAAYDVAMHSQVVYTAEQRVAGNALADQIIRLRTAGQDVTGDGSEASKVLRDGLRIGISINRQSPHDVKAEADALLLSLNGPDAEEQGTAAEASRTKAQALREGLEAKGIILDAFVPDVVEASENLFRLLESGIVTKKSEARAVLNRTQLELEQINARILATLNALAGLQARDELRDLLPKTTEPTRRAEPEVPATPGPIAAGQAEAPAPQEPAPEPPVLPRVEA